jgi:hypothetical protein
MRSKKERYSFASTDMCVEAYPSSANTFVYNIMKELWPEADIAHHIHFVDNLKRASFSFGIQVR